MQILNDPTHPMSHCFDRRRNKSGRFLLPEANANCYTASFLPSVISPVCECVRTSAKYDDFQKLSKGIGDVCA